MADANVMEESVPQRVKIVDVIDCVAANAPDENGRPISMLTLAFLGELEQPLAISYDDTILLVTKLLQSLADHGNDFAEVMLDKHFSGGSDERSSV